MSSRSRNTAKNSENFRTSEWQVPLSELSFTEDEVIAVTGVLESAWWTSGQQTEALEREFADRLGIRHAIAVSSGTAALHLAFLALKCAPGDEVVTPSFNFVAAVNMILYAGAVPRLADVDSMLSPVVSARSLEAAITTETRGLCVMHHGGYACRMDEIRDLAKRRGLWIVEDAAHAPGAVWKGIPCGRWSDVSCFSFFGNKNLTCAEGGMIATENDDLAGRMRLLRSHGMTSVTWDRYRGHSFSYDVTASGFNYRMDDIRAALLRVQLKSLDRFNSLRRERVQWYRELLGNDTRWIIPFEHHEGISSCHLFTVVVSDELSRAEIQRFMKSRGIQTSIHYPPIHQFSYFRSRLPETDNLTITDNLGRRILTLPLFPDMTREQVELVCSTFREAVDLQCR
jgi:dTDP-4-amino-4,6-dideoxygalactose transaminase